jgi:hypothetical protein
MKVVDEPLSVSDPKVHARVRAEARRPFEKSREGYPPETMEVLDVTRRFPDPGMLLK